MRHFIAVIAVTIAIGVIAAERAVTAQARQTTVDTTLDRLSDIASWPLRVVISDPPLPPAPPRRVSAQDFYEPLSAAHAIVVDHRSDSVLFSQQPDTPRPLASITKLMTALVVSDLVVDWSETVTTTAAQVREGNQTIGPRERYTLHDLFLASVVGSYNTAMVSLIESTGLIEEEFVAEMNERAVLLGLPTMHFVDATGLSPLNVGSARDVARLLKIALSHPMIKITSVRNSVNIRELNSDEIKKVKATDWLISDSDALQGARVEGGKTGYLAEAGFNFAVQLQSDAGHEIRVVIMGASDVYKRFSEAAALSRWAFVAYTWE